MKTLLSVGLLALLTTNAIAASPAKKPAGAGEEAGIMKSAEAFFTAWNQHDVKAMVSSWTDDATLINPMGRVAHGKAAIEALLTDEQTTVFKSSTAKVLELKVTRPMGPDMAFCDGEMTVDGAAGPDGAAMPQMKIHLAVIMEKQGANWKLADARPYSFTQPPPAARKAD